MTIRIAVLLICVAIIMFFIGFNRGIEYVENPVSYVSKDSIQAMSHNRMVARHKYLSVDTLYVGHIVFIGSDVTIRNRLGKKIIVGSNRDSVRAVGEVKFYEVAARFKKRMIGDSEVVFIR